MRTWAIFSTDEKLAMLMCICLPETGVGDRWSPGACWPACLAKMVSFSINPRAACPDHLLWKVHTILFIILLCIWVFWLHVCLCTMFVPSTYECQQRALEPLELEFSEGGKRPCGCWEANLGHPEEQPFFLTTESFLQSNWGRFITYRFLQFHLSSNLVYFSHWNNATWDPRLCQQGIS